MKLPITGGAACAGCRRWSGTGGAVPVFLFALVVRVVFAWATPPFPFEADAWDYDRLAHAIVDGRGYVAPSGLPTSERPPLYGYFLAALYRTFDNGPSIARGFQALIDAVTCALVYLLANRMFGNAAAWIGATLAIFSLSLLFATRHLLTETFATFFMVATVFALDVALTGWRWSRFFVVGVIAGLSTLTKGTTLALPAALMLPIWAAASADWRRVARAFTLLVAGFGVTLLPWTIRNYRVHGELVPVATQMGIVVYSSYLPPQGKILGVEPHDETTLGAKALPEAEGSRVLMQAALRHVREHPGELPRLELVKFLYFVSPFDWELLGGEGAFNFTYAFTVAFALYGLWAARSMGWRWLLIAIPPVFLLLLSLALYGSPRLRLPIEPFLMIFAGGGLAMAWRRAGNYRPAFAAVTMIAIMMGITAYVFSAEVKELSAQLLRNVGLW